MVDQIIRPADLPDRSSPVSSEKVPVDNGVTVGGATIEAIVNAGRPLASQAEAEVGVQATKAMTPLTTRQAIDERLTSSPILSAVARTGSYDDLTGAPPPLTDGDKGDITVSGGGTVWGINAGSITEPNLSSSLSSSLPYVVTSRTAMAALDATRHPVAYLYEGGRSGKFNFLSGDLSGVMTRTSVVANADAAPDVFTMPSVVSTAVNASTETITAAAHGFPAMTAVTVTADANGLKAGHRYYILSPTTDTFQLSEDGIVAFNLTGTTNVTVARLHDLSTGDGMFLDAAAVGLSANTQYFASILNGYSFKVASSIANLLAGAFVDLTENGSATLRRNVDPLQAIYVIKAGTSLAGSAGAWVRSRPDLKTNVWWAGAVGDGVTNDWGALQATVVLASAVNSVVLLNGESYLSSRAIVLRGGFRAVRFEGEGTGNHVTAGSAGSCILTTGSYNAFEAYFDQFVNENVQFSGVSFLNSPADKLSPTAIKVVRGNANNRYCSGFLFEGVSIVGYAVGIGFYGTHQTSFGRNFFGEIVINRVNIYGGGYGWFQSNSGCNRLHMIDTLIFDCRFGGMATANAGLGEMWAACLDSCHMEGTGGMFQSCNSTPTDEIGTPVRSKLTLNDFTHEGCGAFNAPGSGNPWGLGAGGIDIYVNGRHDYNLGYGEDTFPYLEANATLSSTVPMRVVPNGGKILTPDTVNAPRSAKRTIADGNNYTFLVQGSAAAAMSLRSKLILSDGQQGYIESVHYGTPGASMNRAQMGGAINAGITLTWTTTTAGDVIRLNVANSSGFSMTAELITSNLSSAYVTTASGF